MPANVQKKNNPNPQSRRIAQINEKKRTHRVNQNKRDVINATGNRDKDSNDSSASFEQASNIHALKSATIIQHQKISNQNHYQVDRSVDGLTIDKALNGINYKQAKHKNSQEQLNIVSSDKLRRKIDRIEELLSGIEDILLQTSTCDKTNINTLAPNENHIKRLLDNIRYEANQAESIITTIQEKRWLHLCAIIAHSILFFVTSVRDCFKSLI